MPQKQKDGSNVDPDAKTNAGGVPRIKKEDNKVEYFGAPANAHDRDDQAPTKGRKKGGKDGEEVIDSESHDQKDTSTEEDLAVKARQTLRKHLNASVGFDAWNMPTATPKINPNRFHDPLDDRFWKDMWVAVAVHNVSDSRRQSVEDRIMMLIIRPRSSEKSLGVL